MKKPTRKALKAELTKDQEPGKDCLTSVHFMIKGEKRIATGFTCSPTGATASPVTSS